MYVCMYICVYYCICLYECTHNCKHVCMFISHDDVCMYVCMYVCVCVYYSIAPTPYNLAPHTHTHTHTQTNYIYACIHTYINANIHTYIHSYIHTYIHTHNTYAYKHTRAGSGDTCLIKKLAPYWTMQSSRCPGIFRCISGRTINRAPGHDSIPFKTVNDSLYCVCVCACMCLCV